MERAAAMAQDWDKDLDGLEPGRPLLDYDWYALRTQGRKERAARRELVRAGFAALLPVQKRWQRPSRFQRRREFICSALMPRYLFLAVSAGLPVPWLTVLSLPMIEGVLARDGQPARLTGMCMAKLVRFHAEGRFGRPDPRREQAIIYGFSTGDSVEVEGGPLNGLVAEVEAIMAAKSRARLVFDGGISGLEVPLEILRKCA
jgi:transcription antitermination factor NusG